MAKLTPEEWCRAALFALGEGGVAALSVERLAKRLGVTKGSFYWHFPNRSALLEAALTFWRQAGTVDVIAQLETIDSPRDKLRGLLTQSLRDPEELRAEAALLAAAASGHPVIGPTVQAVSSERLAYLQRLYEQLGEPQPQVRAAATYAAYLGAVQLAVLHPEAFADREGLLHHLHERLL